MFVDGCIKYCLNPILTTIHPKIIPFLTKFERKVPGTIFYLNKHRNY